MPVLNRVVIVNVIAMITQLGNTIPYAESSSVLTSGDGNGSAALLGCFLASLRSSPRWTSLSVVSTSSASPCSGIFDKSVSNFLSLVINSVGWSLYMASLRHTG